MFFKYFKVKYIIVHLYRRRITAPSHVYLYYDQVSTCIHTYIPKRIYIAPIEATVSKRRWAGLYQ